MGQTGQIDAGDLAADVEVDHHATAAIARRAKQVAIGRIEEEIIQRFLDCDPAQCEQALRGGNGFFHAFLVRMHHAGVNGLRVLVGSDFPDFRDVLERNDEAVARGRLINRRDARGLLLAGIGRRDNA